MDLSSKFLFVLLLALILSSCGDGEENINQCLGFDERQCSVDPFTTSGNKQAKIKAVEDYFSDQNIEHFEIDLIEDFYEGVCEACEICPETYRFIIRCKKEDKELIEGLNLFNLSNEGC